MRCELLVLVLLVGCSNKPAANKSEKPASVAHPAGETEQAVVTLTPQAETRIGLATTKVVMGAMRRTRTVPGEVVVPSGGQIAFVSPFAATVRPISATKALPRAGDLVHRKEKLLRLVPLAPADRDVRAQAEKTLAVAESRLQGAQQKLTRMEKLLAEGAASAKQVEEASADRDAAAAELAAAKKRLSAIDSSPLSADVSVTLEAPADGVVRLSPVTSGQLVAAGGSVLELVQKGGFWVRASVYAGDVASVRSESVARIASLGADPLTTVDASPVAAPPSADPLASTVDYFFVLPESPMRKPGERVSVTLELVGDEEALQVPASAVVYDAAGGSWIYEKTGAGKYARRRIDVARFSGDRVVLARGPASGTEIVSIGAAQLFGVEFGAGH